DDFVEHVRGDDDHAVGVADDHVARQHGRTAAGDGHVAVPGDVASAQHRGVRPGGEGGQADLGDGVVVPDRAVGDHAGGAAVPGAQGEDVAQGAGARVAAGLDDDDLALLDGVEDLLLRVE